MFIILFYLFLLFRFIKGQGDYVDSIQNNTNADESSTPVNQNIYNTKNIFSTPPTIVNVNDYVQIQLYCDVDAMLCKKVEYALISATERFSAVVKLKTKIIFQTRYYSFCIYECSNSTYGWGTPSSQFTLISLNEADSNFIYPQALAKQLAQFTDSSNWASFDVSVDINHDIYMNNLPDDLPPPGTDSGVPPRGGYWFNETKLPANLTSISNQTTIEDYQIDLEYIILHQMIHGLGMVSSWAPYFSDLNSPFQKLLNGMITPDDSLKIMTPSPYWYVSHATGPTYITGFQPNLIFDKFLHLFFSAQNETIALMDYGFDMQNFCVSDDQAFIVYFMNAFLNNATQSTRAKRIYVAMSEENTMSFAFNTTCPSSVYFSNEYLNKTYSSIKLMTGLNIINSSQVSYYRPGIATAHVDDSYVGTPDFLMTHLFVKGKSLDAMIEEGYANVPDIPYRVTETITMNVTTVYNTTVNNRTVLRNETTTETREQTTEYMYRSAIGPGILRILETIGYSTVLTNTNYTTDVVKTTKPDTTCDNNNNNNNFHVRTDEKMSYVALKSSASIVYYNHVFIMYIILILIIQ